MYRLHDFDSGVTQQGSLALAYMSELARRAPEAFDAPEYLQDLARAVNRRNATLISGGLLDEYYPGERSLAGTVFTAYATLKSAILLQQDDVLESAGLNAAAEFLLTIKPSHAANQDIAAAAFLALYAKTHSWATKRFEDTVIRLLEGADGSGRFIEYGGSDLGYATVTLNYLAFMLADQAFDVGRQLDSLAGFIGDFVSFSGRLGGEYASRSTTYFLPFGLIVAASRDPSLAVRLKGLDAARSFAALDDRYLTHYTLPSLARSAVWLLENEVAVGPQPIESKVWRVAAHEDRGLLACHRGQAGIFIGLNKGGTFQVESGGRVFIDCGYRVQRNGKTYSTAVIDSGAASTINVTPDSLQIESRSRFLRYSNLVPSPAKTIILRLIPFLGRRLNQYFKKRLIQNATPLAECRLVRSIRIDLRRNVIETRDEIEGLIDGDQLSIAPAVSPRLVPSARMHQLGEARSLSRAKPTSERVFEWRLQIEIETGES